MILFLLMGLASAVAGMMTASRLGSVRYDLGLGGELQMVLMAMLGGTYIFGGRGTILGTFLAAWLLVIVSTGMIVANCAAAPRSCACSACCSSSRSSRPISSIPAPQR